MPDRPIDATADSPSEPPEPARPAPRPAEPLARAAAADIATEVEAARRDPRRAFGPYLLLSELGRGGMGVVYRAWHDGTKRVVALKTILAEAASEENVQRFRREVEAFARLKHENIVSIHDAGTVQRTHYLVMDYVPGATLDRRVGNRGVRKGRSAHGSLGLAKGVEIVRDVAQALHYAHTRGILHRDLKPQNILLDQEDRPHVLDFGLARVADMGTLTKTGATMGTIAYMPPEQAGKMRETDARSDVYSLGATLYHVLTGHPPFEGPPVTAMAAVISQRPDPPSSVNPDAAGPLDAICLKCLEKDREKRYPTAAALALDLDAYLAGKPVAATSGVRRAAAIVAALAVALVALALGWIALGGDAAPSPSPAGLAKNGGTPRAGIEATPTAPSPAPMNVKRIGRLVLPRGFYLGRIACLSAEKRIVVGGGQLDGEKAVVVSMVDPRQPAFVKELPLGQCGYDPENHWLVGISTRSRAIVAHDATTLAEAWRVPAKSGIPTSMDVDQDEERLYVAHQGREGNDPVAVFDLRHGCQLVAEKRIGGVTGQVFFDRKARKVYTARVADLVVLDPLLGEIAADVVGVLPFAVDSVRGRALGWQRAGSGGRLVVVSGETHETRETSIQLGAPANSGFDAVEDRLYYPDGDTILVVDAGKLAIAGRIAVDAAGPCLLTQVDSQARRLYVVAAPYEAPTLTVFSLSK